MISDREIDRAALLNFKRLTEPDAYLQDLSTHLCDQKMWGVFIARNGFRKPVARLPAQVVEGFAKRDWIILENPSRARLNAAGASWFRRKTAGGDPYTAQHQDLVLARIGDGSKSAVRATVNQKESPLAWLRSRRDAQGRPLVSCEQFKAGERLRHDFERAQMRPHVTANWDFGASGTRRSHGAVKSNDISDVALAAKQRFDRAMDAVGPELAGVLVEVCCFLNGMSGAEEKLGWPRRSGKVVLLIALSALARHYGLLHAPRFTHARISQWSVDDYRPSI